MLRFDSSRVALLLSLALYGGTSTAQRTMPRTVDPLDYPSPVGGAPTVSQPMLWQLNPLDVEYDLVGGFRPIYSGARQPIGHEIIPTRPDGNGYVYRPLFAPSPGYHYSRTPGGALIIEFPAQHPTKPDAPFPSVETPPTPLVPATPGVAPRHGPYEF